MFAWKSGHNYSSSIVNTYYLLYNDFKCLHFEQHTGGERQRMGECEMRERFPVVMVLTGRCAFCQDVIWADPSESSNEV